MLEACESHSLGLVQDEGFKRDGIDQDEIECHYF